MHVLLSQAQPFLSCVCWCRSSFLLNLSALPLQPHFHPRSPPLPSSEQSCSRAHCSTVRAPPASPPARRSGLAGLWCAGAEPSTPGRDDDPQLAVALQLTSVDSGSPGRADTFAFLPVGTICSCCASSRLLLGASLFLGCSTLLAVMATTSFLSSVILPRIAGVPSPPNPPSHPVCSRWAAHMSPFQCPDRSAELLCPEQQRGEEEGDVILSNLKKEERGWEEWTLWGPNRARMRQIIHSTSSLGESQSKVSLLLPLAYSHLWLLAFLWRDTESRSDASVLKQSQLQLFILTKTCEAFLERNIFVQKSFWGAMKKVSAPFWSGCSEKGNQFLSTSPKQENLRSWNIFRLQKGRSSAKTEGFYRTPEEDKTASR